VRGIWLASYLLGCKGDHATGKLDFVLVHASSSITSMSIVSNTSKKKFV
jgi:hypothetical protein